MKFAFHYIVAGKQPDIDFAAPHFAAGDPHFAMCGGRVTLEWSQLESIHDCDSAYDMSLTLLEFFNDMCFCLRVFRRDQDFISIGDIHCWDRPAEERSDPKYAPTPIAPSGAPSEPQKVMGVVKVNPRVRMHT